ncbi:putative Transmembrane protein [Melia azedarach]|uniref:Transmembrane protein n=1 Tax=Melia azedarach TaxID=155640 RepID=A0ACC1Z131_MELAZ|nr:putative Transmembrane protein [Melia azedarach]
MAKKAWSLKKVVSKESFVWPWKLSGAFKWKRLDFQMTIIDDLIFKIMYVVEAVVLVSTLCFFFLCCGCHF